MKREQPASDHARQVHLMVKKRPCPPGASYGQEAYCPFLNVIEGVWRLVKGFLMPRRCYNSVVELREALLVALKALGGVEL